MRIGPDGPKDRPASPKGKGSTEPAKMSNQIDNPVPSQVAPLPPMTARRID